MVARWLFDVDGTLIDSLTGRSLRPGATDLLAGIRATGAEVVLWSAGGAEYSRERALAHGIDGLVDAYHEKAGRDGEGRFVLPDGIGLEGTVFVDDRPEDLPVGATVVIVFPYLADNPHDRAFAAVAGHLAPHLR